MMAIRCFVNQIIDIFFTLTISTAKAKNLLNQYDMVSERKISESCKYKKH